MKLRAIKLRAVTAGGVFGFEAKFSQQLTIIRGNNTSGKSLLINSILFALGMEELIGGRNDKPLPSAIKSHLFDDKERKHSVLSSEVLLELENRNGVVRTLRRAARDVTKSPKLVEVFDASHLTEGGQLPAATSFYLHDAGAARVQGGFHHYLASFLGLDLPEVPAIDGESKKLYIQTVFAAFAVEQKRGWTDYLANLPHFQIRDARQKATEFILGFDVFESATKKQKLLGEGREIEHEWQSCVDELDALCRPFGISTTGVPTHPTPLFDSSTPSLNKLGGQSDVPLSAYTSRLSEERSQLELELRQTRTPNGQASLARVDELTIELQRLNAVHTEHVRAASEFNLAKTDYESLKLDIESSRTQHKTALKLEALGATHGLRTSEGTCPTCFQEISNSLLVGATTGPVMSPADSVEYLDAQHEMLERQIETIERRRVTGRARIREIESRIADKHDQLVAERRSITDADDSQRTIVRRQIQIELELKQIDRLRLEVRAVLERLQALTKRHTENLAARKALPKHRLSDEDEAKIRNFQTALRKNAEAFGYTSAPPNDIELNHALIPALSDIELREITSKNDVRTESSASDFVRLIWSYLLALFQTAVKHKSTNHLGLLILDEPGQHSMSVASQHALFDRLSKQKGLQSIVAASFDDSNDVFVDATKNIPFHAVNWAGKLLKKIEDA